MDLGKARGIDVRIDLRGADIRMTQQFLNRPNIRPMRKHVRGGAMPENMR